MGCAPAAHVLFNKFMTFNPQNPNWLNRDRFVLSYVVPDGRDAEARDWELRKLTNKQERPWLHVAVCSATPFWLQDLHGGHQELQSKPDDQEDGIHANRFNSKLTALRLVTLRLMTPQELK